MVISASGVLAHSKTTSADGVPDPRSARADSKRSNVDRLAEDEAHEATLLLQVANNNESHLLSIPFDINERVACR